MYLSLHNKKSKKEIIVSVPINLRKYYKVDTLSNFFSSMNINPGIIKNKLKTFKEVLDNVNKEFKEKLNTTKIKQYLSRDVKTGTNFGIDIIPLNIKKFIMKKFENLIYTNATSTISNVGVIDIDNNYKKFIDNIFVITKPWKMQKIKCSICSYEKKLNITINSNIKDEIFHQTFYNLLKKDIKNIKCISNITNNIY